MSDTTGLKTISMLAPINHLPAEGEEWEENTATEAMSPQELLKFYTAVVGEDGGLHSEVSPDGITPLTSADDSEDAPLLQYLEVKGEEADDSPYIDLASAFSTLSLPTLGEVHLDEGASEEEHVRAFLDALKGSLNEAAKGFAGTPVPLIRWRPAEDGPGGEVQCLGLWLAEDSDTLSAVAEASTGELGAIFEESEIEGRGLREMAASLAVIGLFVSSTPSAEAGLIFDWGKDKEKVSQKVSQKSTWKKSRRTTTKRTAKPREIKAEINENVLARASSGNSSVLVDISAQRAYFIVDGQVAIDTPVSTARPGKHTPRGEFKITQKVRTGKTSTIYGCDLPCWMRLNQTAIGLHVGDLPGYPASAGCVRLPWNVAPVLFEHASSGTTVKIVDSVNIATVAQL